MSDLNSQDELTEQIYEAAKRKAINPYTGETLSFDQIIKRNCQEKIDREAERQLGGDRLEAGLPIDCPIPPEMIRSSFKDWADGWGIWLMDGTLFDEQVDEAKSANPSNYQRRKIGWYVHYDVEGEGTDSKVKATFDPTLDGAWNAYVAHTARPNKNWALDYAMSVRQARPVGAMGGVGSVDLVGEVDRGEGVACRMARGGCGVGRRARLVGRRVPVVMLMFRYDDS